MYPNSDNLIDFVVMWVDGSDPEWQKEKSKYKTDGTKANTVNRYRDWDIFLLLQKNRLRPFANQSNNRYN